MTTRPFRLALGAIVLAALALRAVYAWVLVGDDPLLGDALEFHLQANDLADGHGYIQPFLFRSQGIARASADKPPLYPLLEAAVSVLGGRTWAWHQLVGVVCGAGTVAAGLRWGKRILVTIAVPVTSMATGAAYSRAIGVRDSALSRASVVTPHSRCCSASIATATTRMPRWRQTASGTRFPWP